MTSWIARARGSEGNMGVLLAMLLAACTNAKSLAPKGEQSLAPEGELSLVPGGELSLAPEGERRVLLAPEITEDAVRTAVAEAARAAGVQFVPGMAGAKCRRVELLDAAVPAPAGAGAAVSREPSFWLGGHGFVLRLRRKLEPDCVTPARGLAVSFNRRIADAGEARAAHERLVPTSELEGQRTKSRFKELTVVGARPEVHFYWVGGTVRRLAEEPRRLRDLAALFPAIAELSGYEPSLALGAVGGMGIIERNHELGTVAAGGQSLPLELAFWRVARGAGEPAPLIAELGYPAARTADATRFVRALDERLEPHYHRADTRESLIYDLAVAP